MEELLRKTEENCNLVAVMREEVTKYKNKTVEPEPQASKENENADREI